MNKDRNKHGVYIPADTTDKANEIILNWCKEHPATTRQSEFLEMFPNVALVDCEFINICPKDIDIQYGADCNNQSCRDCKKEYWLAEALEKQIPFKPTKIKEIKEYNCKFGNCKCGERVINAYGYCLKCGQALDWSDTE